jgi:hypothetical protein
MKLPLNLKPTNVVIKRLPTHLVGRMRGENYLAIPTVQLSGSALPCELDLIFDNLPYFNTQYNRPDPLFPANSCGFEFSGFDSGWQFFNDCKSGVNRFTIDSNHSFYKTIGESLANALSINSNYWRITDIKESGRLKDIRNYTISIVQCSRITATNILLYSVGTAKGRALNPLLASTAIGQKGVNDMIAATAIGANAVNQFPPNPATATTANIPVDYKIANYQLVANVEYDVGREQSGVIPVEYELPRSTLEYDTISDSYEYSYERPRAYIVKN